jgi:phosphoesterase RecJ-like protein
MVSHVKPDGDTLGAGLALGLALKKLGEERRYFQQDRCRATCAFLPDAEFVSRELPQIFRDDALYVFCDMSDWRRAGELSAARSIARTCSISTTTWGTRYFGKLELRAGERVLDRKRRHAASARARRRVDARIATCILAAIMTDTGAFMHSNTTPEVLELSAELMRSVPTKSDHAGDLCK